MIWARFSSLRDCSWPRRESCFGRALGEVGSAACLETSITPVDHLISIFQSSRVCSSAPFSPCSSGCLENKQCAPQELTKPKSEDLMLPLSAQIVNCKSQI